MISVFNEITLTFAVFFLYGNRKSFSVNLLVFTVFDRGFGRLFFLILNTSFPSDTINLPPTKTFEGFIFVRLSKIKKSASLPGAIPPRSFPIL